MVRIAWIYTRWLEYYLTAQLFLNFSFVVFYYIFLNHIHNNHFHVFYFSFWFNCWTIEVNLFYIDLKMCITLLNGVIVLFLCSYDFSIALNLINCKKGPSPNVFIFHKKKIVKSIFLIIHSPTIILLLFDTWNRLITPEWEQIDWVRSLGSRHKLYVLDFGPMKFPGQF